MTQYPDLKIVLKFNFTLLAYMLLGLVLVSTGVTTTTMPLLYVFAGSVLGSIPFMMAQLLLAWLYLDLLDWLIKVLGLSWFEATPESIEMVLSNKPFMFSFFLIWAVGTSTPLLWLSSLILTSLGIGIVVNFWGMVMMYNGAAVGVYLAVELLEYVVRLKNK